MTFVEQEHKAIKGKLTSYGIEHVILQYYNKKDQNMSGNSKEKLRINGMIYYSVDKKYYQYIIEL